jgi:hypothetical protein
VNKFFERVEAGLSSPYDSSALLPDDLVEHRDEYYTFSDEGGQVKHIYACAGLALYSAQCFEVEAHLVLILAKKASGDLVELSAHQEFEDRLSKMTQGQLVKALRNVVEFNDCSKELLDRALRDRNALAHSFFERHSIDFLSNTGRVTMLNELLECVRLFRTAESLLMTITNGLIKLFGTTREEIERQASASFGIAGE